ncbi:MAG TPA: SAM-dependent chlorinase/fluorinase, partial [Pirellulales bacterium]|nr:SAM-dependent chlorinase/fluorinase [Pirellulales bacterium]
NRAAQIVDVAHNIPPQNVRQAAILLAEATTWFPAGSIHVAVVDPGVGTERRIVYASIGDQQFVAPDNGVLSRLAAKSRPSRIIALENSEHWLPSVSNTFHGRDIMAPVAAQVSLGMEPDRLGPAQSEMVELNWPAPQVEINSIRGEVTWIDGFGNLITNVSAASLASIPDPHRAIIEMGEQTIRGFARTYGDQPSDTLVALAGSAGFLEIAVVNGNAAARLSAGVGASILVRW